MPCKLITMTGYRRPLYTREVLAALAKCRGVGGWTLLPSVEPVPETAAEFSAWSASEMHLAVNRKRLGLNANTHAALHRARKMRPSVVVHLEDDTVPSPDALEYFEWAVANLPKKALLASGYNKPETEPPPEASHVCDVRRVWTPWGWAVGPHGLRWLMEHWSFRNAKCFTCHVKKKYGGRLNEVYPLLSRVQNIGYEMGENDRTPEWYRANHRTPWTAGDVAVKNFEFQVR